MTAPTSSADGGRRRGARSATIRACSVAVVLAVTAGACSRATDTTAVNADAGSGDAEAPTSSIAVGDVPSTTEVVDGSSALALGGTGDPTSVLTGLLAQFAASPQLVSQLGNLDAVGIAGLVGLDLADLQALELTPVQIQQLARTVVDAPPELREQLVLGTIEPAALLGLLGDGLDLDALGEGAVSTIVQGLLGSIGDLDVIVSPELSVNLSELFEELDLEGFAGVPVNESNASLIALITSAWLGSNPLLAQQLLSNPLLDPVLGELLAQLSELSKSITETAQGALLDALLDIFPGLAPLFPDR